MSDPADDISSPWLTPDREVISPNAPAGGGGPGRFRTAGSLGTGQPFSPELPSPDSPAARLLDTPDPLQVSGTVPKPPPVTKPDVFILKQQQGSNFDFDVKVEVLADGVNTTEKGQAHTKLDPIPVKVVYPDAETDDVTGKVTKITGKFTITGTATIQTRYKRGVNPADPSAYGRGTTIPDKASGDVSVGFHESCHISDMVKWLKAHTLPTVFTGKVGMTKSEYQAAMAAHGTTFDAYWQNASDQSEALTDEQGGNPSRSQYLTMNP